jgi:dipeptidyl aminopeptidase/acylaminoacyl peptidase
MNRRRDMRAALVVVLVVLAGMIWGGIRRADAMVPEDILSLRTAGVADLSPDGRFLLYTIGEWDTATDAWSTSLYRRDLDTGDDLLVFTPADASSGAVWRPDGQAIAFLRTDGDKSEIWLMNADGADRRRLSRTSADFGALHWSPDGSALAWVASAPVGTYAGSPADFVVADGIGYRHLEAGYREGRRGQLFVMDLANGEPRRLFEAPLDVRALDWSPDGRQLVFEAKAEADLGWNLNTDLWIVARAGGALRQLTVNPGPDGSPAWSRQDAIAYRTAAHPLWETAPRKVAVVSPELGDSGPVVRHGTGFDDFLYRFATADEAFYILGARRGCLDLLRVDRESVQPLTAGPYNFYSLKIAGGRVVLTGSGPTLPGAIFTLDLPDTGAEPQTPRVLIDPNQDWSARAGLTEPEPFSAEVDGRTINGWFFKPEDLGGGQRVPVVLSIHGGPEWMYGGYFLPEFHILPRFGYGVVIANPTGSMGYGTEFMKGVRGEWIGRPARELLACLDLAVAEGWADPERLALMGGSYGGHLGAALTTQTDRFRAAALDRMYPETISFWGTTDEKWFPEWEFKGRPWEPAARAVYLANSPFEAVDRVTTPTLISHGLRDYRCLIAGGEIWFAALQAQGIPSRFIRFENEGHGIRRPPNKVFYQNQLLDWFDRFVLGGSSENGSDD